MRPPGYSAVMDVIIVAALLLPGLLFLFAVVGMAVIHPRELFKQSRPGICNHCGYNLTGNRSGVCPECGSPIRRDRAL
jgi:hypothetical protein